MHQNLELDRTTIGALLKEWRIHRRMSQLDLASEAEISQRHLSFMESGRSKPSRDMLLHLADHLSIPLRDRNSLLIAAGFAPAYEERSLDDPALGAAKQAVETILQGHTPHPALAIDRHWSLISANQAVYALLDDIAPALLEPPVNVLRLSLHPDGLARSIINIRQWRHHIFERLRQQIDLTGDAVLTALLEELQNLPIPGDALPYRPAEPPVFGGIAVPLELSTQAGRLRFISTTTIFGTALDVTLSELAVETFFPLDDFTADTMRQLQTSASG